MNNSNLRKKLSRLKPVATSRCGKALNSLGANGNNAGIETEARFGKMERGRFVPGVSKRTFDEIESHFKSLGWTRTTSKDRVVSRALNPRQNIRRVESSNSTIYEMKERLNVIDVQPNYRLAKSKEKRGAMYKLLFEKASSNKEYTITRDRISFKKDNLRVDLTQGAGKYQVEVEFSGRVGACKLIEEISEMIEDSYTKGSVIAEYRKLMGPKFAGPLPQTLTLDAFKKRILTKKNYSVTEKADGERYLLFVDSNGNMSLLSRGMNIVFLKGVGSKPDFAGTVLDGELYRGKFYTFDILMYKGQEARKLKLPDRLMGLYRVLMEMRVPILKMKTFFVDNGKDIMEYPSQTKTSYKNIYEAASKVWGQKKSYPYPLDGLIFTPTDDQYFSKGILKWKDENTIDLYYNGSKLYLAGFGADKKEYKNYPFGGVDGSGTFYTKDKKVMNDIFTDEKAPESVRKGVLQTPITGPAGVGEFVFEKNTFKLIRKRTDKQFGNGILASNQVWESITKPLTIAELSAGPGAMRDFHSEIKSKMIMKYTKGKAVLDIGSGKGEDVGKYIKAGAKKVVGFDLVQEEYPHPNYMKFYKMNGPVYSVKNYINKSDVFDVVNINFAIHYFLRNKAMFQSLVMNIHENLKKGGILMATVLDGRLVYQALKNKPMVNTNKVTFTKKYNNATNFNSPKFKLLGREVEVMVKGTKYFNKPISEFLFNFEKFMRIMEEMGFELVEKGNFSEFCSESEWCRRYMTDAEKDYSFKNIYFVLRKR
jgi:SAM-dependent methyltransferase